MESSGEERSHSLWLKGCEQNQLDQKGARLLAEVLCTEVIGLNAWLALVNVPWISRACQCEFIKQTVQHVLLFCPLLADLRPRLYSVTPMQSLTQIFGSAAGGQAATHLLIEELMAQFKPAKEVTSGHSGKAARPELDY